MIDTRTREARVLGPLEISRVPSSRRQATEAGNRRSNFCPTVLGAVALAVCAPATGQARGAAATLAESDATPAVRYARLDPAACESELTRRGAAFASVDKARGVLAPIRLTGPLRGVSFHSVLPPSRRAGSPFEILDCRLALALDDFSAILAKHAVVEVVHLSMYRPPPRLWPEGRASGQHGGGLAIDAGQFRKADGQVLDVDQDFAGTVGATTCGPNAVQPSTVASAELRSIVCEAAEAHLFNVELSPNYNKKHKNHFHLEVTANARWFLVR
jgi:hypothetical protein